MRGQVYPHEVFTDVPTGVSEKVEVTVMRELMRWCNQNCEGRYAVMTTNSDGDRAHAQQRLSIQFEAEDDAQRFTARFG